MPRAARSGKRPGPKAARKPPEPTAPGAEGAMAVRMLVGPKAGQVVRVTRAEAVRLCEGWTPQAELVARNVAAARETRAA